MWGQLTNPCRLLLAEEVILNEDRTSDEEKLKIIEGMGPPHRGALFLDVQLPLTLRKWRLSDSLALLVCIDFSFSWLGDTSERALARTFFFASGRGRVVKRVVPGFIFCGVELCNAMSRITASSPRSGGNRAAAPWARMLPRTAGDREDRVGLAIDSRYEIEKQISFAESTRQCQQHCLPIRQCLSV